MMNTVDRAERLTILGKNDAGRPISLSAGFLKEYNFLAPESSPATFHFDRAFLGAHFPDDDSAALTELSARIPAIDHWLGISGEGLTELKHILTPGIEGGWRVGYGTVMNPIFPQD